MNFTEKELYDLPLGSKAIKGKNEYLKIRNNAWEKQYVGYAYSNSEIALLADKILIPTTWGEYIPPKPILDNKEKEYLSYIIRPWRNRVKYIKKFTDRIKGNEEYICIQTDELLGVMLPSFKAGTMYKGMEINEKYSLKELEL